MIQIGSGHQILVAYIKHSSHFIGHFGAVVDGLLRTQTHLELQVLAQTLDRVQMDASLIVHEEMAHFADFPLHAQAPGQHAIQHLRLSHLNNIEFGQFGSGHIGTGVLDQLRWTILCWTNTKIYT